LELRRGLLEDGHEFRSATDSEVVVHLYEKLGPACVSELNGMFAFALWDRRTRRLLLARDRYGVKPLYYTWQGTTLAFASEAKAFLALPGFRASADPLALAEHLTFQNTFGERTLFHGVNLLQPGHRLLCGQGETRRQRYWNLCLTPETGASLEDWAARLRHTFERAVDRQLMSDVPVGSFLSGGMDTGAISAVAVRRIPQMHTFTCGFDLPPRATELERFFDEREASDHLARYLGTTHHQLQLGADAMALSLPEVVWHLDEPRVGISYQILYTTELVRRYVTVVLSGTGGDELFAGYPWRYEPLLNAAPQSFESLYYRQWVRLLSDEEKRELFTDEILRALGDVSTFDTFREAVAGTENDSPLDRALCFDFKTFLAGMLLVEDKMAMAHSVEARVPFLDNDLVDLASRVPFSFKLKAGQSKIVLKKAMEGLLPTEVLRRRKQGFTPPDETWYRYNGISHIREVLLGERARGRGFFRPRYIEKMLDDHLHGRRNHRSLIWSLLCFEWWNRLFIDREPLPPPLAGPSVRSASWPAGRAAETAGP
jgi:asparagine synthase (glutamine-hydrolysing)